jgi:hypothetical protein
MSNKDYYLNVAREQWAKGERITASLINNLYRFGVDPVAAERAFNKEQSNG